MTVELTGGVPPVVEIFARITLAGTMADFIPSLTVAALVASYAQNVKGP